MGVSRFFNLYADFRRRCSGEIISKRAIISLAVLLFPNDDVLWQRTIPILPEYNPSSLKSPSGDCRMCSSVCSSFSLISANIRFPLYYRTKSSASCRGFFSRLIRSMTISYCWPVIFCVISAVSCSAAPVTDSFRLVFILSDIFFDVAINMLFNSALRVFDDAISHSHCPSWHFFIISFSRFRLNLLIFSLSLVQFIHVIQ